MDLEGWEILPEDGYLEIQYDGCNKIFSRKYGADEPNNLYKNNYFIYPSQDPSEFMESSERSTSRVPKQLPVPIQLSPFHDEEVKQIINKEPIHNSSSASVEKINVNPDSRIPLEADRDTVSQVFFKKMIENKSVDMKLDSPKSKDKGLVPQKDEILEGKSLVPKSEKEKIIETNKEVTWGQDSGGLNMWKWSLNGLSSICSFGVVAASICIIILGGRKQNKHIHQQHQKV